jgi:hypothetical protein
VLTFTTYIDRIKYKHYKEILLWVNTILSMNFQKF